MIATPSRSAVIPFLVVLGVVLAVGGLVALGIDLTMTPPAAAPPPSHRDVACTITEAFLGATMSGTLLLVVAVVLHAGRRATHPRATA